MRQAHRTLRIVQGRRNFPFRGWGLLTLLALAVFATSTGRATYILADQYAVLAWAEGHTGYASSAGFLSLEEAQTEAVGACERLSGTRCMIAASSKNGIIVLALADDGSRVAIEGGSLALARSGALQQCLQQGRRCAIVDEFSARNRNGKVTTAPSHAEASKDLWGTIAWRADRFPGNVERVWAVSQHKSQQDAVRSALRICMREEGAECTAKAGVRNVFLAIYAYEDDAGTPLVESDLSPAMLRQAIDRNCAGAQYRCRDILVFDVRKPLGPEQRIDPVKDPVVPPALPILSQAPRESLPHDD